MKNFDNTENAMQGRGARSYPMVEIFPFAGKIKLSAAALEKLGCKAGNRVKLRAFEGNQLFIRKTSSGAGYLLRPAQGQEAGRVEFIAQTMVRAGNGAHCDYSLKDTDLEGWFEIVPKVQEVEVRRG